MHYGVRAKEWITDHDIKQKKLAEMFHITESMMSNYLTGRNDIPVDVLVKFARNFDISMDYLVGLSDDPKVAMHLSDEERDLVERFRALYPDQRELAVQNIGLMQEQNQRR